MVGVPLGLADAATNISFGARRLSHQAHISSRSGFQPLSAEESTDQQRVTER